MFRNKEELEKHLYKLDPKWWFELPLGKVNEYRCGYCSTFVVTQDIDRGVTPAFMTCVTCTSGTMKSWWYRVDQNQTPTRVWYRPDGKELKKLLKNPTTKEHISRGGLILKEAEDESSYWSRLAANA